MVYAVIHCRPVGAGDCGRDKLNRRVIINALTVAAVGHAEESVGNITTKNCGDAVGSAFLGAHHHLVNEVEAIDFCMCFIAQGDEGRGSVAVGQVRCRVRLQSHKDGLAGVQVGCTDCRNIVDNRQ